MKKEPTEKQRAYWEKMSNGGWEKLGRSGGLANVAKYGSEHLSEIGRMGGLKLVDNLGGREKAKGYFARIARIKTRKENI